MNWLLNIPFEFRLLALIALGAIVGSLINLCIYRLAWGARSISPWSEPDPKAAPRHWSDRIPIVGWLGLKREDAIHGANFWIRPMLVEIIMPILFAVLYWWEVDRQALWGVETFGQMRFPWPAFFVEGRGFGRYPLHYPIATMQHACFLAHLVLLMLMIICSIIDFDEKTIPDIVTVPGTLLGLVAATVFPWSQLSGGCLQVTIQDMPNRANIIPDWWVEFFTFSSPRPWPTMLEGYSNMWSLLIALGCFLSWIVALLPRPWRTRRGWRFAFRLLLARMKQGFLTWPTLMITFLGIAGISAVWYQNTAHWIGLFSALAGMFVGGGIVWTVRVVASRILGREAMGFGDVTLMAMIGSFVGWQSSLIIFFVAPLFGLTGGILLYALRRDPEIYYGPFLCMATALVIVRWTDVWTYASPLFNLVWFVPTMLGVALVLMIALLGGLSWLKSKMR